MMSLTKTAASLQSFCFFRAYVAELGSGVDVLGLGLGSWKERSSDSGIGFNKLRIAAMMLARLWQRQGRKGGFYSTENASEGE